MNSYPPELLVQLSPTMLVAGLKVEQLNLDGARPQDQFTVLTQRLKDTFMNFRKEAIWRPENDKTFQVFLADKTFQFPPRKVTIQDDPSQPARSPLSPLMKSSPLYPDGLIAPVWIRKHISLVPSVFVLFLRLYESPQATPQSPLDLPEFDKEKNTEKQERLKDTELSAEIAERKKSTNERNIKLTVVLLATRKMLDDPSLDARLTYIRRQSGLDSRAALFVLSPVSSSELSDFIQSLQQALYEPAIEYYSAHSKRVRRKRNRHNQSYTHVPSISISANPSTASTASTSAQSHTTGLHAPSTSTSAPSVSFLRPEGWAVRYEYKMAAFAEFRGENEVALKHYRDSYAALLVVLSSTAILPPRTKRWAEAKVLADCINIKICRLYLYNSEHALALSQHNLHMRRFADLSRGWGIGDETFEFWSWRAKQYRVFAELIEYGLKSTLKLPSHLPTPSATLSQSASAPLVSTIKSTTTSQQQQTDDAASLLGTNPSTALQHPGFYYVMAAECMDKRRAKFSDLMKNEESKASASQLPGFENETQIDHFAIILELYTKSYELFKRYAPSNQTQNRLPLQIAYSIAQTYYKSGKVDLAAKFFERISKTYRYERWRMILQPLLSNWYACARQMGDVELSIKLLIEMICCGYERTADMEEGETIVEDLLAILKSTVPSSPDKVLTIVIPNGEPILNSNIVFWSSNIFTDEVAPFQIHLSARTDAYSLSAIPIKYLQICVGGNEQDGESGIWITVRHVSSSEAVDDSKIQEQQQVASSSSSPGPSGVTHINLGNIQLYPRKKEIKSMYEVNGDLTWSVGTIVVLSGNLASRRTVSNFTISKAVLGIEENGWHIEVPLEIGSNPTDPIPYPTWLDSIDPPHFIPLWKRGTSFTTVRNRPHRIQLSILHDQPAYVGEHYPITVQITNEEEGDKEFEVIVDFLLQPGEDDSANRIVLDNEESMGLIRGVSLGRLKSGDVKSRTIHLIPIGIAGDRTIDISVQSRLIQKVTPDDVEEEIEEDINETLQTLSIPVVNPFKVSHKTRYYRKRGQLRSLVDLRTFEKDYWDDSVGGEATVQTSFELVGVWDVDVKSVHLVKKTTRAKVLYNALDEEDTSMEWSNGDVFNDVCQISIRVDNGPDEDLDDIPGPGYYEISWTRSKWINAKAGSIPITQTIFPLPSLRPPRETLIALVRVPPAAYLHEPTKLELTIRNHHPSRSAHPKVTLDASTSEGFVVSGLRSGRLPILLPGSEETVTWSLIPLECGYGIPIPNIKVVDMRNVDASEKGLAGPNTQPETEGVEIPVVDISWERTEKTDIDVVMQLSHGHTAGQSVSSPRTSNVAAANEVAKGGRRIAISVRPRP